MSETKVLKIKSGKTSAKEPGKYYVIVARSDNYLMIYSTL